MYHAQNEVWEKSNSGRNRTTNHKSIRMLGEKENYKYLAKVKADTIKEAEMKKIKKTTSDK